MPGEEQTYERVIDAIERFRTETFLVCIDRAKMVISQHYETQRIISGLCPAVKKPERFPKFHKDPVPPEAFSKVAQIYQLLQNALQSEYRTLVSVYSDLQKPVKDVIADVYSHSKSHECQECF